MSVRIEDVENHVPGIPGYMYADVQPLKQTLRELKEWCPVIPLGNRILIFRFAVQEKQGDIYVPQTTIDASQVYSGVVVRVGPDCYNVKEGDLVSFKPYDHLTVRMSDSKQFLTVVQESLTTLDKPVDNRDARMLKSKLEREAEFYRSVNQKP